MPLFVGPYSRSATMLCLHSDKLSAPTVSCEYANSIRCIQLIAGRSSRQRKRLPMPSSYCADCMWDESSPNRSTNYATGRGRAHVGIAVVANRRAGAGQLFTYGRLGAPLRTAWRFVVSRFRREHRGRCRSRSSRGRAHRRARHRRCSDDDRPSSEGARISCRCLGGPNLPCGPVIFQAGMSIRRGVSGWSRCVAVRPSNSSKPVAGGATPRPGRSSAACLCCRDPRP